jgi:hypothetical protein
MPLESTATVRALLPLSTDRLRKALRRQQDEGAWSVGLTLTTGQRLLGDLRFLHVRVDGSLDWNNAHIPRSWPKRTGSNSAFQLLPFEIVFNHEDGTTHGRAYTLDVPEGLVAGVDTLYLSGEIGAFALKNIPNPFARALVEHNTSVAHELGLKVGEYLELALAVTPTIRTGISFKQPELIYSDLFFLSSLASANMSVRVLNVTLSRGRNLDRLAFGFLRGTLPGKLALWLSGNFRQLENFFGFLHSLPKTPATSLEGEDWFLVLASTSPHRLDSEDAIPVLVNPKRLRYPLEFLPYVSSPLKFLGERRQIPIDIAGRKWSSCLMARVIGYIGEAPV